jgi:hypothetical protein
VTGLLALALVLGAPSSLAAQEWTVDAYAGRAVYDPVSANVGTNNGVLGVRYDAANGGWFHLSAAVPFAPEDMLWGAAGLGHRFATARERLVFGIDAAAHGYAYRHTSSADPGAGVVTQALPFAAAEAGIARVRIHSGLLHHANTVSGQTVSRAALDSGLGLALRGTLPLELGAEGRYVRVDEGGYPYAGGLAAVRHGKGDIWASVGRWFSDALPDLAWGFGASLDIGRQFSLWASVREEAAHPLFWNDGRQSWNIGVSRRLGNSVRVPAPAPPPTEISGGRVTIRVPVSESEAGLFVAGDFTGWRPVAMTRSGQHWTVTLPVGPGFYHYAFRTANGRWFVPGSVPGRRDDGFGGHVAVLVVP